MKYKLVPVEPTDEMRRKAGLSRGADYYTITKIWRAMLDAAPDVEQEPVAWIIRHPRFCGKFTDNKAIAEHWENEDKGCTAPLFLHQQPAPDTAKLVEALETMIEVAKAVDSWESFPSDPIEKAEDAIRAYRKQGGDL